MEVVTDKAEIDALASVLLLGLWPLAASGTAACMPLVQTTRPEGSLTFLRLAVPASLLAFSLWPLALLPQIQWPLALFRLSACMLQGHFAKLKGSLTILVLARPL